MIVAEKPPLDEDLLMHFGVKGMRWGVSTKRTPKTTEQKRAEAISKLNKKLENINGYSAFQGDLIRQYGEKRSRANKREFGNVDQEKFNRMSLEEKARYEKRGATRARTGVVLVGGAQVAALMGGGFYLASKVAGNSRTAQNGRQAVAALSSILALKHVIALRDISTVQKRERIRYQIQALEQPASR